MPRILIRMLSFKSIKNGTSIICVHRLGVSSLTVGLGVSTRPPIFHLRLQNYCAPGYDASMAEVLQPVDDTQLIEFTYCLARLP